MFVYIYLTRIVVRVLAVTLAFDRVWLSHAFAESSALAFYCCSGCVHVAAPK